MATGMFDALNSIQKGQRQEDVDEQRRLQFMAADPTRARALAYYEMSGEAGKGLAQAGSALAGRDPRTRSERDVESVAAAKAAIGELPEVDLSTPEGVDSYYKGVIGVLRQNNLPAEAHAASVEWNKERNALTDRRLKDDEIKRKAAADAAKAKTEEGKVAAAAERNRLLAQRGMGEFVGWVDRIEKTADPATRKMLLDRVNAEIGKTNRAGQKVVFEDAGDRVIVRDESGAILGTDMKGVAPLKAKDALKDKQAKEQALSSYDEYMAGLQKHYDAAVTLYNHKGLPGITGRLGRWKGEAGMLPTIMTMLPGLTSNEALGALGIYDQLAGGAFLAGLAKLKAASKTGSTGLGAVSEKEGDKVQADAMALNRYQQAPDFRESLSRYLKWLEEHAQRVQAEAAADANEIEAAPPTMTFSPRQLAVPRGQGGKTTHPPLNERPDAAPRAPAQPASEPTVTMTKNGKTREVRRSMVEEAKRRGYTESK